MNWLNLRERLEDAIRPFRGSAYSTNHSWICHIHSHLFLSYLIKTIRTQPIVKFLLYHTLYSMYLNVEFQLTISDSNSGGSRSKILVQPVLWRSACFGG